MTNWSWLEEWVRKDKRGLGRLDYQSFGQNDPDQTRMIKIDLKLMTKEQLVSNVEDLVLNVEHLVSGRNSNGQHRHGQLSRRHKVCHIFPSFLFSTPN